MQLVGILKEILEDIVTKLELIDILQKCIGNGDFEVAHSNADQAIMEWLEAEGHGDIVSLFHDVGKWYA